MNRDEAVRLLEPFRQQNTVLLTTYRRSGAGVGTPVSIAVEAATAYVRTWSTAGKIKRIRNNPVVQVQASTFRGRPTSPKAIRATARLVEGEEAALARRLLGRKHPVLHRALVPVAHKVARYETVYLRLSPTGEVTSSS